MKAKSQPKYDWKHYADIDYDGRPAARAILLLALGFLCFIGMTVGTVNGLHWIGDKHGLIWLLAPVCPLVLGGLIWLLWPERLNHED